MAVAKFLFLDTNIYLHYQLFDQIKWREIADADHVTIIVPPLTIRELNKHKDGHSQPRVKKRAAAILKRLYNLFDSGPQAHLSQYIQILHEDREPLIDFGQYQLSREIQDDQLIASMIACQTEHPETACILVTSDMGMNLDAKARRQHFTAIRLPDSLKLAEEPDPEQQRIKDLERRIQELTDKVPNPTLIFSNDHQHIEFELFPPIALRPDEIQQKMDKIRQKTPKMKSSPSIPDESATKTFGEVMASVNSALEAIDILGKNSISDADIAEYNEKLDKYFQRYISYLEAEAAYKQLLGRIVKLQIFISNSGTAPAEDLDVRMHFPDGFELVDELPSTPDMPSPPPQPLTLRDRLFSDSSGLLRSSAYSRIGAFSPMNQNEPPPNVSSPTIRRTNSYDVKLHVGKVKHGLSEELDPLYVVFDGLDTASSFEINYRILAGNLPREVSGTLHVIIKKPR